MTVVSGGVVFKSETLKHNTIAGCFFKGRHKIGLTIYL